MPANAEELEATGGMRVEQRPRHAPPDRSCENLAAAGSTGTRISVTLD
jgi:hypothetical protein